MTKEELRDEIEAIDAIYPESVEELGPLIYKLTIPNHESLSIQITFPEEYPDTIPEIIQLVAAENSKTFHEGEVVVFELFSEIEQFLEEYNATHEELVKNTPSPKPEEDEKDIIDSMKYTSLEDSPKTDVKAKSPPPAIQTNSKYKIVDPLTGWYFSDPIIDRGSTFIGFAREVHSVDDAAYYIDLLTTDKKVAKSNHNMTAWRIKKENGVQYQDCDDDGETAAGGRMLHLLTMMDVWNVVVVVSRWFGGTHIGPG
ncbi:hypothetical protein QCA50_009987 [Cerrena zonata]|uniref:RWD domain-containing protein n=1 Tax=Cerrena zonata TaxID=2478898 RepID=A0AAW0G0B4_9APHY